MKLPPGGGSRHPQAAGITLVAMMPSVYECASGAKAPSCLSVSFPAVETAGYNDGIDLSCCW